MTDLPRFHKGGLGPLDFQAINEAFRRLDALRPLIETAGIKQSGGISSERVTVVTASRIPLEELPDGVPTEEPLYRWREVLVRGANESLSENSLVEDFDSDFSEIQSRSTYRSGPLQLDEKDKDPAPGTGYGVSVDPNFEAGICILVAYNRTDSTRVQLLCPLTSASSSTLFVEIVGEGVPSTIELTGNCGGGGQDDEVGVWTYNANKLQLFRQGGSTKPSLCRAGPIIAYDFSIGNANAPSVSNVEFEAYSLQNGNIVVAHAMSYGADEPLYVVSTNLPRLDFECQEQAPGVFKGGGGASQGLDVGEAY